VTTRYQQTDSRLAYAGTWYTWAASDASGGNYKYANSGSPSVTVKFTGTNLNWVGVKGTNFGIAKITIDGTTTQTVDLYNASPLVTTVWSSPTLASGTHTVKIEWTGTKNTKSTATYIAADAFDVAGTLVEANASTAGGLAGKVVVIDPGHQQYANTNTEPVGPGSTTMKMKVTAGTSGISTHIAESQFVLDLGLQLRDVLKAKGITVVMTRTTQAVNISNVTRAKIANDAHASLFVRIHADGWTDASYNGLKVLYPASITGWTDDIAAASKSAATIAQSELIKATGAKNLGIVARSDLTGFNWSNVPVILPEVGFMTNVAEDKLMATKAYRDKLVNGMAQGIIKYLSSN
jgi:N-acetylmuramoyl-L-alanine amidase